MIMIRWALRDGNADPRKVFFVGRPCSGQENVHERQQVLVSDLFQFVLDGCSDEDSGVKLVKIENMDEDDRASNKFLRSIEGMEGTGMSSIVASVCRSSSSKEIEVKFELKASQRLSNIWLSF
jgi:hypothetical protein